MKKLDLFDIPHGDDEKLFKYAEQEIKAGRWTPDKASTVYQSAYDIVALAARIADIKHGKR